jgi:hypothetical protein
MVMKRLYLLKFVLVTVIAVSLVSSFVTVYSDDEPTLDLLCSSIDFALYSRLLSDLISSKGIYYEYNDSFTCPGILIVYLARNEKSPPGNSAFLTIV